MNRSSQIPGRSSSNSKKLHDFYFDNYKLSKLRLRDWKAKHRRAESKIATCVKAKATRLWLDKGLTRIGGFLNLIVAAVSVAVIIGNAAGLCGQWVAVASVAGGCYAAWVGSWFLSPSDVELERWRTRWHAERSSAAAEIATLTAQTEGLHLIARALKLELEEAEEREASARNQLLASDWMRMTGREFEDFLQKVFEELGFDVQTTKTSGDQGVDLVVSCPAVKIAVQAKGYPNTTVGNSAVQEAFTGMKFYGCNLAVVITNSTFTRAAKELAARVDCLLVDASDIPDLIDGEIFSADGKIATS